MSHEAKQVHNTIFVFQLFWARSSLYYPVVGSWTCSTSESTSHTKYVSCETISQIRGRMHKLCGERKTNLLNTNNYVRNVCTKKKCFCLEGFALNRSFWSSTKTFLNCFWGNIPSTCGFCLHGQLWTCPGQLWTYPDSEF